MLREEFSYSCSVTLNTHDVKYGLWHSERHKTTHPGHHSLTHRDTRRPGHRPRDVDTTDHKYKQKDGHAEKVHEQQGIRRARARLLAFRETRAILRRTSTGERCEQHAGPTKRIGPRGAPAAASDESARSGWSGWVLSLFPMQAAEAKL